MAKILLLEDDDTITFGIKTSLKRKITLYVVIIRLLKLKKF